MKLTREEARAVQAGCKLLLCRDCLMEDGSRVAATNQWQYSPTETVYLCSDHADMIENHLIAIDSRRDLPEPLQQEAR